jgi:hypothetical protein
VANITHISDLEIHGQVIIDQPHPANGIRRVWYGTPEECAAVCNVTGKRRFTNAATSERIGSLRQLRAYVEEVGPRELEWVRFMIAKHQAGREGGRS